MNTKPVATQYTHEFIQQHLPINGAAILEVGCGCGELALRLLNSGAKMVALDSDAICVAEARSRGLDARLGTWPTAINETFDAVLFTRSLHHIAQLDDAVAAAVRVLRRGGKIIVEDFGVELVSARNDAWFSGLMRLFAASGMLQGDLDKLLESLNLEESRHHLHLSVALERVLGLHGPLHREDAAYYFRYAEAAVEQGVAALILDYELSLIRADAIDALGKRFVCCPVVKGKISPGAEPLSPSPK